MAVCCNGKALINQCSFHEMTYDISKNLLYAQAKDEQEC